MVVAQQFDDLFLDDSSAAVFSLPESMVTVSDFEHPQTFVPRDTRPICTERAENFDRHLQCFNAFAQVNVMNTLCLNRFPSLCPLLLILRCGLTSFDTL